MFTLFSFIIQIEGEKDEKTLQEILVEAGETISNAGYTKPLILANKGDVIRALTLQYTILQCVAELEQFKNGLTALGFLTILRANRHLLSPFFVHKHILRLTAGNVILAMLHVLKSFFQIEFRIYLRKFCFQNLVQIGGSKRSRHTCTL